MRRHHGFGVSYGGWRIVRVAFLEHGGRSSKASSPSYSPREEVRRFQFLWGTPSNLTLSHCVMSSA